MRVIERLTVNAGYITEPEQKHIIKIVSNFTLLLKQWFSFFLNHDIFSLAKNVREPQRCISHILVLKY